MDIPNNETTINLVITGIGVDPHFPQNVIATISFIQKYQSRDIFPSPDQMEAIYLDTFTLFQSERKQTEMFRINAEPPNVLVEDLKKQFFGGSYDFSMLMRGPSPLPNRVITIFCTFKARRFFGIKITEIRDLLVGTFPKAETTLDNMGPSSYVFNDTITNSGVLVQIFIPDNNTVIKLTITNIVFSGPFPHNVNVDVRFIQGYKTTESDSITGGITSSLAPLPRIIIQSVTDEYLGKNFDQCLLRVFDTQPYPNNDGVSIDDGVYMTQYVKTSRSLNLVDYVIGDGQTLIDKVYAIAVDEGKTDDLNGLLGGIILHATLTYFLGFLIYGCFNPDVILRSNFKRFLVDLNESRFSEFVEAYSRPEIKGFERYFRC